MLVHKQKRSPKRKVLYNSGDFFNGFYYIYKERYEEEKSELNAKDTKKFDKKELRLIDDYQYESEGEKEQIIKKPDKKEPLKKTNKI